jgi:hypothetical protein
MGTNESRREFIEIGAIAGGCLLLCPLATRLAAVEAQATPETYVFDETMGYCCAECTPAKCKWLGNDMEFKTQKARELSEKLSKAIKPEEITCSRCRIPEKTTPEAIARCPIRACVVGRGLLSCAHCRELEACKRANPITRERALAIQSVVLRNAD